MEPNYVLKIDEAVLMPVKDSTVKRILKVSVCGIVIAMVLGSLLFMENLFLELSDFSKGTFIALVVYALYTKREETKSPMELQFFDDYLVLYLPKRYYDRRTTRMVSSKMKYEDITKCVYYSKLQRVHVYGAGVSEWCDYDKTGNLLDRTKTTKVFDEGLLYFSTLFATDIDFKKEIEAHAPITVNIENR